MRYLRNEIEEHLDQAWGWWRFQLFFRRSAILATAVTLGLLLLGCLVWLGWIRNGTLANLGVGLLIAGGVLVWFVIGVMCLVAEDERSHYAQSIEQTHAPLMDRLNTLVHLQERNDPASQQFARAIERQTVQVLSYRKRGCPYSWQRSLQSAAVFVVCLTGTIWFYRTADPWNSLEPPKSAVANSEAFPELEIPPIEPPSEEQAEAVEEPPWGEIRISQPGRDLKITTLDVVKLQIEAAANRPLTKVIWFTTKNADGEITHALPPPEDQRYVIYNPEILPEQFALKDWDILSYRAEAETREGATYRTEVYFLHVLPFLEEIEKLPGGSQGVAYQLLDHLTQLAERQQEVIRQTAEISQWDASKADDQKEYAQKLAKEEQQLSQTLEHLSAQLESHLDPQAIQKLTQSLSEIGDALNEAGESLQGQNWENSQREERAALEKLSQARRDLHELAKSQPELFTPKPSALADSKAEELREPEWEDLIKQLDKKADANEAAREQLEELVKKQESVEQALAKNPSRFNPQLSRRQEELEQQLERLIQEQPQAFENLKKKTQAARDQLDEAANALKERQPDAKEETREARETLDELYEALQLQEQETELAQSKGLEQKLARNIEKYKDIEEQPEKADPDKLKQTTEETKELIKQLDEFAQRQPPPSELEKQLTPEKKQELAKECEGLCQQPGASGRKQSAGAIKQGLESLADSLKSDQARQQAALEQQQNEKQLEQIKQARQQRAADRQFVKNTLLKQRNLERQISPSVTKPYPELAKQQEELRQALEDYRKQNPENFDSIPGQCQQAENAMQRAGQSMKSVSRLSRQRANEAADQLQKLDDALEQQQRGLTEAYQLKQILDRQIDQLQQMEQKPEAAGDGLKKQTADISRSTADSLKNLAEQPSMQKAMGEKLGQSLTGEKKQQLDERAEQLERAQSPEDTKQAAGGLRQSLEQIAKAFEQGQPQNQSGQKPGQSKDSLKPQAEDAIAQGLRQLESADERRGRLGSSGKPASEKLQQEAVKHLVEGISSQYGHNEKSEQVLQKFRERGEEPEVPISRQEVEMLLRQVQHLRREVGDLPKPETEDLQQRDIDPSKFPVEYRESIRKYYENLSKQK